MVTKVGLFLIYFGPNCNRLGFQGDQWGQDEHQSQEPRHLKKPRETKVSCMLKTESYIHMFGLLQASGCIIELVYHM